METKHETYGRVVVDELELNEGGDFVDVRLLNLRDNLPGTIMVGKCALKDQGNYKPKFRAKASRVEQYLPLVASAVSILKRPNDDWDELYAVGSMALVEADMRWSIASNNSFAAYAKPYIMGYIKNHQNPHRSGEMYLTYGIDLEDRTATTEREYSDVNNAVLSALPSMTKKQQTVVKMLLDGHTEQNIADKMGIHRSSVQDLKRRAIQHVRRHLD